MGRMYIVNHWNDAAAYSGEQIGDRLKDSSAVHFNRDGSANVELYSEETALAKKKTSIPLRDRILPQHRRVQTLTDQLIELEQAYKSGVCGISEYSTLRAVLVVKRNRATELYKKAISVQEPTYEDHVESPQSRPFFGDNAYRNASTTPAKAVPREEVSEALGTTIPRWITDLPAKNSFKSFLISTCRVSKTLVKWLNRTKAYYLTLKDL